MLKQCGKSQANDVPGKWVVGRYQLGAPATSTVRIEISS